MKRDLSERTPGGIEIEAIADLAPVASVRLIAAELVEHIKEAASGHVVVEG